MKTKILALIAVIMLPLGSRSEAAQAPSPASRATAGAIEGTVVTSRSNTLTVRTDDGRYVVFILDRETQRPQRIAEGVRVRVDSAGDAFTADEPARATVVRLVEDQSSRTGDTLPPEVRRLERQIEASARRYRAGIRAGVGLDPELVSFGAHATLGPIFSPRLLLRPNFEIAYGELTTLLGVNLEAIYRLTPTILRGRWSPYAGGGPSFGFTHRGFSTEEDDGRSFDFDDLSYNGGLNLVAGVERPGGVFLEVKTTVYAEPHFRLIAGFTF